MYRILIWHCTKTGKMYSLDINSLMSLCKAWLSLHQFNETCQCSAAWSVPNMAEICQEIWKLQIEINLWCPEKCYCPCVYFHGTHTGSANLCQKKAHTKYHENETNDLVIDTRLQMAKLSVVPRGGGLGCSKPPRNSEDIGGVLDRTSKKNRCLDFLLYFTVFSYGCNLLNKGLF